MIYSLLSPAEVKASSTERSLSEALKMECSRDLGSQCPGQGQSQGTTTVALLLLTVLEIVLESPLSCSRFSGQGDCRIKNASMEGPTSLFPKMSSRDGLQESSRYAGQAHPEKCALRRLYLMGQVQACKHAAALSQQVAF